MKRLLNTLYVTNPNAYLCKEDDNLLVRVDGERAMKLPFHLLENIVVFGFLGCSPALLGECSSRGITLAYLDERGRFLARVEGPISGNVLLRRSQYRWADDTCESLRLGQRFIAAKIRNCKVVVQRFRRDYPEEVSAHIDNVIGSLAEAEINALCAQTLDQLRGVEGDAAHCYFSHFPSMIRIEDFSSQFTGRVRRPPTDPVNALLSFFYSLLSREIVSACETVGLDPQVGFLHRDRPGRASLSLDVMEEMRPYVVDRFVLSLINRKQVDESDFIWQESGAVLLKDDSRKKVLGFWQDRKQELITHPYLEEKIKRGLLPYTQILLLARHIRGDLDDYPAFLWR